MSPFLINIALGIFFILIFGGMSLLRREGLSLQFAVESLIITIVVVGISFLLNTPVDPILFLVFIYLITMRCRLLVDIANALSSRGRQRDAIKLLQWAMNLRPDRSTSFVIQVNMGIVQLRRKNPESAQELFFDVLQKHEEGGGLGIKYEAACRYNLGLALIKLDREAEAVRQFNETMVVFPTSIYSKAADKALRERRSGRKAESSGSEEPGEDV